MIFKKQAKDVTGEPAPPTEALPPESLPLKELPLRERLPQAEVWPGQPFGTRFAGRTWMYVAWPATRSNPWPELPAANRFLLSTTGICILWLALRLTVPPLYRAGANAVFPYTAAGKQATCLDNLKAIHQAVALYTQDHGGDLPPLDTVEAGQRATWVSLVRPRAEARVFQCPKGPAVAGNYVASYVLNPVLALHRLDEPDDPSRTLLLADGGNQHDVSLLPPLPTWPSFQPRPAALCAGGAGAEKAMVEKLLQQNREAEAKASAPDPGAENLALRHSDAAGALYADGHAEPLFREGLTAGLPVWGGSLALRASLQRLEDTNPRSREFIGRLRQTDVEAAGRYYAAHRKALQPVAVNIVELWKLNGGEQTSDSVQAIGWNLARAAEQARDASVRRQLDEETGRRVKAELDRARQAEGQPYASEQGYGVFLPPGWTKDEKRVGRYLDTYIRSPLPDLYALIETGDRNSYIEPCPIDWGGSERDLVRRYGRSGYRRVGMGNTVLLGNAASSWEYEVEKPGSPRLRKLCIGYVSGWQSHVLAFTAPARDFEGWRPIFQRAAETFGLQHPQ